RVGASTRDDRHALSDGLHTDLDDTFVLLMGKCGALASRSDRNKAVRTLSDLPFDDPLISRLIESAVLERRDQRRERSLKHVLLLEQRLPEPNQRWHQPGRSSLNTRCVLDTVILGTHPAPAVPSLRLGTLGASRGVRKVKLPFILSEGVICAGKWYPRGR